MLATDVWLSRKGRRERRMGSEVVGVLCKAGVSEWEACIPYVFTEGRRWLLA